jgi:DNA-binding CsgD family transcriptional regulator
MKVSDILRVKGNTLYTVTPDEPLGRAAEVMADKDIGSLVVMDHGDLVGMLTFREVIKQAVKNELIIAIQAVMKGNLYIHPAMTRALLPDPVNTSGDEIGGEALTQREIDVLKLVAQGYVNKEIALKLGIGAATVSTHIKNLYRKLAVHTRVQVVKVAQERGLI